VSSRGGARSRRPRPRVRPQPAPRPGFASQLRRRAQGAVFLGPDHHRHSGEVAPACGCWVLATDRSAWALMPYQSRARRSIPRGRCRDGCRASLRGGAKHGQVGDPAVRAVEREPGLAGGTVPRLGLAYAAVGGGLDAVGAAYHRDALLVPDRRAHGRTRLDRFPAGDGDRIGAPAWPGEVTPASPTARGRKRKSEPRCRRGAPEVGLSAC